MARVHEDRAYPAGAKRVEHYSKSGTLFFYGGPFSSFAYRDIWLPPAYYGATETEPEFYNCREAYFAACKATSRADHDFVVGLTGAERLDTWSVKDRGRQIELRPDWDSEVGGASYRAMLTCIRHEVANHWDVADLLEHTGERKLAEDSPSDYIWGIRDERDGFGGRNLLGLCWMQARYEMRHTADCRLAVEAQRIVGPWLTDLYTRGWIRTEHDLQAALATLRGTPKQAGPKGRTKGNPKSAL